MDSKNDGLMYTYIYFLGFLLLVLMFFLNIFFIPQFVKYKAQDIKNIRTGIMCQTNTIKNKHGIYDYYFTIDGGEYKIDSMLIMDFPFVFNGHRKKFNDFNLYGGDRDCYEIKYLSLDFFIFNKRYIYDLVE